MTTPDDRYTLVFNGEIFNFLEIRKDLESSGVRFKSNSDTEVILHAVARWGLEASIERFVGMFAFAFWDEKRRTLSLVRDRLGIKPLYYGWNNKTFWFASELRAVKPVGDFEIASNSLNEFIQNGYIAAPDTIFKNSYKLLPGSLLTLTEQDLAIRPSSFSAEPENLMAQLRPRRFWSFLQTVFEAQWQSCSLPATESALVDLVESQLEESVRLRMISDVPIGAFLSGGIDSSLVSALMQKLSGSPINTFTIGFEEAEFNEAKYARRVAQHLGTNHHEEILNAQDCLDLIPSLASVYDEPFADSSQIPTFLISRIARQKVTVALSGDGGDELFAGYTRYRIGRNLSRLTKGNFARTAGLLGPVLDRLAHYAPDFMGRIFEPLGIKRGFLLQRNLRRLTYLLNAQSDGELYTRIVSQWEGPCNFMDQKQELKLIRQLKGLFVEEMPFPERMMVYDALGYLPDDILVKLDRASMFSGLEARVPLLDHRIVSLAWRLPLAEKMAGRGPSKLILRKVLARHIPQKLIDRPKMGFSIPIETWLRGRLREWATSLINDASIADLGLNQQAIRTGWQEFVSGRQNSPYGWWSILMFISWHNDWKVQSVQPLETVEAVSV